MIVKIYKKEINGVKLNTIKKYSVEISANPLGTKIYINGKETKIYPLSKPYNREPYIYINKKIHRVKKIMCLLYHEKEITSKYIIERIEKNYNNNHYLNFKITSKSSAIKRTRDDANKGICKLVISISLKTHIETTISIEEAAQKCKVTYFNMANKLKNGIYKCNDYIFIKQDLDIKVNPKLNFIPVPGQSFSICIQYPHLIKKKNNKLARIEKRDKLLYYKNKNIIYYLCCALAGEILPSKGSCSINKDGYKYVTIENVSYYIKKFDKKIEFTIKKANRIISSHIFYY